MKINRLKIVNYKLFQNVTIEMNENINIFVGENDSGKSTILEALSMVLTGKINGSSVANRLNLDWFNAQVRQKFKESIEAGNTPDLPTIEIEVYFASPDEDEIAIKKYTFESFKSIIYLGKDIESRDPDSIKSFMIGNKTDWSMRVFTSEKKINYPSYILKAIGIDSENVGDRDE